MPIVFNYSDKWRGLYATGAFSTLMSYNCYVEVIVYVLFISSLTKRFETVHITWQWHYHPLWKFSKRLGYQRYIMGKRDFARFESKMILGGDILYCNSPESLTKLFHEVLHQRQRYQNTFNLQGGNCCPGVKTYFGLGCFYVCSHSLYRFVWYWWRVFVPNHCLFMVMGSPKVANTVYQCLMYTTLDLSRIVSGNGR